jgi:hypothetical protein
VAAGAPTVRAAHIAHLTTQSFGPDSHPHGDTAAFVLGILRQFDYDEAPPNSGASYTGLLAAFLKGIFGNPFRPVAFDPRWRTADTVGLATGIYEDRAFDRLPLLADALMDVGCDNDELLEHCRVEGPHVRGCWLIDRVLGRE